MIKEIFCAIVGVAVYYFTHSLIISVIAAVILWVIIKFNKRCSEAFDSSDIFDFDFGSHSHSSDSSSSFGDD